MASKQPWEMTGPELIEALCEGVFSSATMKAKQAKEVEAEFDSLREENTRLRAGSDRLARQLRAHAALAGDSGALCLAKQAFLDLAALAEGGGQ